jgi:hypothetical protein
MKERDQKKQRKAAGKKKRARLKSPQLSRYKTPLPHHISGRNRGEEEICACVHASDFHQLFMHCTSLSHLPLLPSSLSKTTGRVIDLYFEGEVVRQHKACPPRPQENNRSVEALGIDKYIEKEDEKTKDKQHHCKGKTNKTKELEPFRIQNGNHKQKITFTCCPTHSYRNTHTHASRPPLPLRCMHVYRSIYVHRRKRRCALVKVEGAGGAR